jgi:hypothetical protein
MEIDPKLLPHRSLVLDHEHGRTEHLGRPVHLEPGRQRWKPQLTSSRIAILHRLLLGFSKVST